MQETHTMKRQTFFLSDHQIKFLKTNAKNKDLHLAELIRRIIDEFIDNHKEVNNG